MLFLMICRFMDRADGETLITQLFIGVDHLPDSIWPPENWFEDCFSRPPEMPLGPDELPGKCGPEPLLL